MNEEIRSNVLPIYFVADESYSMSDVMNQLNHGIEELKVELERNPFASSAVRLTLLGFSDDTVCYLSLEDVAEMQVEMPKLSPRGATQYSSAFNELYQRIPGDVDSLKAEGNAVYRPAVFFLTDGAPTDETEVWKAAHKKLVDESNPQRPHIFSFGIGGADKSVLYHVATKEQAYMQEEHTNLGEALAKFVHMLTNTIIQTGTAAAAGAGEVIMEKPEGFMKISLETI